MRTKTLLALSITLLLILPLVLAACGQPLPTPIPELALIPTQAPIASPTPTSSLIPIPTPVAVPTLTPALAPTATRAPVPLPTQTASPSPAPTQTSTATPVPATKPESDAKLGLHTTQATGGRKFVVVQADFPDVKRRQSETFIGSRVLGFVPGYYREASYGKLEFKGEITRRYVLPGSVAGYKISSANLKVDPKRVTALITDVVNLADSDIEFSNDLHVIISLGATQAEYGMVGYCGVPGMLGWQSQSIITAKSGEMINSVAVFCENAHLGTYIHDTLHMLGGLVAGKRMAPCLYDHDLQAQYPTGDDWPKNLINMGFWDPLSSHFPFDKELPPAGLSSWTKMRLNWIEPSKIALAKPGQTTAVRLGPLADASAPIQVLKVPLTASTYYLLENRQKISSDVNLPSSGILILYCDDSVSECRNGMSPVKIMDANPAVPYYNDAAFDIGKRDIYVDSRNNIAVVLAERAGQSYDIRVTTPDNLKR